MRRLLALVLLTLASCGGPLDDSGLPQAPGTVGAAFQRGGEVDVIVVTAVDRRAIRSAALVSPSGLEIPAYSLTSDRAPQRSGAAAGVGSPLVEMGAPQGGPTAVTRYDQTVSTASIRLPDPDVYGRTWPQWRIRVEMGMTPGEARTVEIPAPAPPP